MSSSSTKNSNTLLSQAKSKNLDLHKVESAALLIQYTVRRWLAKRWMEGSGTIGGDESHKGLHLRIQPHTMSEERARNLQHEIETWQHRNKVRSFVFYVSLI